MAYKLVVYEIVYFEIEEAFYAYNAIAPQLGELFMRAVQKALDDLENIPQYFFNLEDSKHRRIVVSRFPYGFIYCIDGSDVLVKKFYPMQQDPDKTLAGLI